MNLLLAPGLSSGKLDSLSSILPLVAPSNAITLLDSSARLVVTSYQRFENE